MSAKRKEKEKKKERKNLNKRSFTNHHDIEGEDPTDTPLHGVTALEEFEKKKKEKEKDKKKKLKSKKKKKEIQSNLIRIN